MQWKNLGVPLPALAAGLWLGVAANPAVAGQAPGWPAPGGPLRAARWQSRHSHGGFDTKGRDLMAFNLISSGRAFLGRFNELVCDGGSFIAKDASTWLGMQLAKSRYLHPGGDPHARRGLAEVARRGLAFADDKGEEVALVQDKCGLALRLGGAQPIGLFAPDTGKPVHVLVACDKDQWTAYQDGKPAGSGKLTGAAPAWAMRELVMGANWAGEDPWHGRMEAVAVFPRALTAAEAAAQAAASKRCTRIANPPTRCASREPSRARRKPPA